jgi:hypothetical protein
LICWSSVRNRSSCDAKNKGLRDCLSSE